MADQFKAYSFGAAHSQKAKSWFSWKLYWKFFAALAVASLLALGSFSLLVWHYAKEIPSLDDLRSISPILSTQILDKNGEPFGEFFVERRTWCPIDSIPPVMRQAVISIEDRRFYDHWGINMSRLGGAIFANLHRFKSQGASTITQQLARNVFLDQKKNMGRKIKEAITAVLLERYYTKDQILEYYLNQVYLGASAYGVQAAAHVYFGKDVKDLRPEEAALLAGLIQRPESLRPDRNPDGAKRRRNMVLKAMADEKYITQDQYQELASTPLDIKPFRRANSDGAYFLEAVRQHIEKTWGEDALYHSGLTAYTTVDREIQVAADRAVTAQAMKLQKRVNQRASSFARMGKMFMMPDSVVAIHMDSLFSLYLKRIGISKPEDSARVADSIGYNTVQASAIVIDNATGAVRALTGGRNFDESKFNRAMQSLRQAGSTFKPFIYGSAIEQGALPSDVMLDDTMAIDDGAGRIWTPHNYDNKYEGPITLRRAMALSKNLPTIQVGMKYGVKNAVELAHRFGITSNLPQVYALALGSADVTLWDMVSAYSVFANLGTKRTPHMIDSIMSRQESALERFQPKAVQVMDSGYSYIALDMLRDVVRRGTGSAITSSGFSWPAGGKTGTTNDYTDAWYIGFTKQYTCGIWIGFDQKKKLGPGWTGAIIALPVWLDIMKVAQRPQPRFDWPRPSNISTFMGCGRPGADGTCAPTQTEFVVRGSKAWDRIGGDSAHAAAATPAEPKEAKDAKSTKAPEPKAAAPSKSAPHADKHAEKKPESKPKHAEAKAPQVAPAPDRKKPTLF